MGAPLPSRMTEAEYLAYDLAEPGKHEFVNGEVVAMAGASEAHSTIVTNTTVALASGLRGRPCRVHGSDLRVRLDETGLYAYPDLSIVCGKAEFAETRPESLVNPTVLVEVLSTSTESYDRGAKLEHYRRRASVQLVVLIDSRERRVTTVRRNPDQTWTMADRLEGDVAFEVLGLSVPLDVLYADADEAMARARESTA